MGGGVAAVMWSARGIKDESSVASRRPEPRPVEVGGAGFDFLTLKRGEETQP